MATQITQASAGALFELRGGEVGRYEGRCPLNGRHRVTVFTRRGAPVHPKHIGDGRDVQPTTWLIADDGCCRGDKAHSPKDFVRVSA